MEGPLQSTIKARLPYRAVRMDHPSVPNMLDIKLKRIILRLEHIMEFALLCFGLAWDLSPLLFFLLFSFGMAMSILYLSDHHILEVHNLSGFTGLQLERNFLL